MKPTQTLPKIGVGDLVAHPQTGNKGLVTEVKNGLVKFKVLGRTTPGGAPIFRSFERKKLVVMATKEQIDNQYNKIVAAKELAKKRAQNPIYRLARWAWNLLPSKAAATPQPA